MQTVNKGGDVLARGGVRNQFPPAGGEVTQDKWDSIFADFDPEKFKNSESQESSKVSDDKEPITR